MRQQWVFIDLWVMKFIMITPITATPEQSNQNKLFAHAK
jgi:hypothetical protein